MTSRTTTPIERVVLRYIDRKPERTGTMHLSKRFGITVGEAVYLIQIHNHNPEKNWDLIQLP